jgi:HNH endonuclease/FCS type zinc finger protein
MHGSFIEAIHLFVKLATLPQYTKVYGPYNRRCGKNDVRQIVVVVHPDGRKETLPYPRFLVEQRLNRKLDINETVDHKDRDSRNNDPLNLQLLPRSEHSALDTRRVKLIKCKCVGCGKQFERSPRLLRDKAKKGKQGPFCSKSCAARYTRKVQLGLVDKAPIQKHTPSKYWRRSKAMMQHAAKMYSKWG